MNDIFQNRTFQAAAVLVFFLFAFMFLAFITGNLKERFVDRYNLLILKIAQAGNIGHLVDLDFEIAQFYDDFYDRNPVRVTEMTCELHRMNDRAFARLRQTSKLAMQ